MKKFLFTLAALMMAGSLCAEEYFYLDNIELTQEEAAAGVKKVVNVKGHFDCLVNAWQTDFVLPEGVTIDVGTPGADMTLTYWTMFTDDETLEEYIAQATYTPELNKAQQNTRYIVSTFATPEYGEDGTYYGALKYLPGDYEQMWRIRLVFPAGFQGGDIVVETQPSSGADNRPGVEICPKGQDNFHTATVTVAGGEEPQDLTGEIVVGEPTEDGLVAISYNGTEDVTIVVTLNGEVVELVDGMLQLAEGENTVVVTVSAEDYNDMVGTYNITWTAPVEVTEAPTINWNPETFTVEAVGNGEVLMYVDGELVANPYTFDQTDVEMTYTVTATAQEPGKEISDVATLTVTVPAKEVTPVDPDDHTVGYWLVMLDKNNNPVWYKLNMGEGGYQTSVSLNYEVYGRYNHDTGYRGDVPFYFVVNNVVMGADEDMRETLMGSMENTLGNPLFADAEYDYGVPVGYNYVLGIYENLDGEMFVYCAQAGYTGVDELMNGKAVAGVRYFNMAGQEMTEANGVTIVVTTYTDGTTSAVKVMK